MSRQGFMCSPVLEDQAKLLPPSSYAHQRRRRTPCSYCPKIIPGPSQTKFIIVNELCERFSYYGLRAILIKFLQDELLFDPDDAAAISLFFGSLCYATPLMGGYIADSYLGKYYTILIFSIVYCCGGGLLALSAHIDSSVCSFIGLGLIGIGTGGIKPCVSTFGADQFPKGGSQEKKDREIESYFMAFYFSINFGSIGSFFVIPIVREHYGYFWAFLVPAIALLVALFIFVAATNKYVMVPPGGSVLRIICGVCCAACSGSRSRSKINISGANETLIKESESVLVVDAKVQLEGKKQPELSEEFSLKRKPHFLDRAVGEYPKKTVNDVRAVWDLIPIFLCWPCFWALFDQQANTWEQQAEDMDTWIFQADQMSFWNPLLVMILIPVFDKIVYPLWGKCHPSVTALHKMMLGMVFCIASYIMSAFVQEMVQAKPGKVSVFWQLPQYILITFGEILISITGLEFAYTQAPLSMKAFIASLNLTMVAIGDLTAGVLYGALAGFRRVDMFFLFAGLMGVNLLIFIFFARRYKFKVFNVDKHRKSTSMMLEESKKRGLSVSYAFASRESVVGSVDVPIAYHDEPASYEFKNDMLRHSSEGRSRPKTMSSDLELSPRHGSQDKT